MRLVKHKMVLSSFSYSQNDDVNWKMQKSQQRRKREKSGRAAEDKLRHHSYMLFISLRWPQWVFPLNGRLWKHRAVLRCVQP